MSEGKYEESPATVAAGEAIRKRIEDSLLTEEHFRKLERRWERAQHDDDEAAMQGLSASVPLLIREIRRLRAREASACGLFGEALEVLDEVSDSPLDEALRMRIRDHLATK